MSIPEVIVARRGSDAPGAPLVVLLHGRGSNEREILSLGEAFDPNVAVAALRGPLEVGPDAYAWFANAGIGRPVAESLRAQLDWFYSWLATESPAGRRSALVGFSGGAAFAAAVALDRPELIAATAVLYGTVPFDAGLATGPGSLAGVELFHAQAENDEVMPATLMERTWTYLTSESGANLVARRTNAGHRITPALLGELGPWVRARVGLDDAVA